MTSVTKKDHDLLLTFKPILGLINVTNLLSPYLADVHVSNWNEVGQSENDSCAATQFGDQSSPILRGQIFV